MYYQSHSCEIEDNKTGVPLKKHFTAKGSANPKKVEKRNIRFFA